MNDLINIEEITMIKNIKRIFPMLLTFLLIFNLGIGIDFPVYADSTRIYNYENYTIEYKVKTEWTGNQDVGVTVKNTSDEPLQGWAFEFDAGGDVKNVFGAEVYDNDETTYILKSTTDNNTIKPGETASFSYTVFGNNISEPRAFRLVSKRVVLMDGYSVSIKSNANNKAKFDGSISLMNIPKNPSGNNGYSIFTNYKDPNLEFAKVNGYYAYNTGEIMINSGQPCSNDIEMILQAFCENCTQLFYADSRDVKV
jgi:hypothetical protein